MTLAAPSLTVAAASCAIVALLATYVGSQTLGYVPKSDTESSCLKFALDLYNNNSGRAMRAGPLSVGLATLEVLQSPTTNSPTEMWYRFFNTVLVDTTCSNTPRNEGATLDTCPIASSNMTSWRHTCDFKVWYSPAMSDSEKFQMIYMMCYV